MTQPPDTSTTDPAAQALQEAFSTLLKARELAEAAAPDAAGRAASLVAVASLYLDIHSVTKPVD